MEYNTSVLSLGYVISKDRQNVLMLFYNLNENDYSYGKYNGYSDFVKQNESAAQTFDRIVYDMTGLITINTKFRGSIHWPNFRDNKKSFFSQIFICDEYHGEIKDANTQGSNRWVPIDSVLRGDVPIWEGDKYFLPLVFDDNPAPFHGNMPYDQGNPCKWSFQRT